jgi:feruloyl esterase
MDGKEDGLISDPVRCSFDPEVLICQDGTNCLSREKVEVLKKWYQGPVNANGAKLLTTGVTPGSEPLWGLWLLGGSDEPFDELLNSENALQYAAFREDPGDSYSVFEFDFDSDPDRLDYMGSLLDVNHLSLKSFKEEGGKLLMFHGLADPAVPYQSSVDYYNQNYKEYGEETNNFFRLFLVPGMDHCTVMPTLGITQDSADPLTALENWVEKDRPPHELPVTRFKQDGSVNSRFNVPLHVVRDK